jgi:hypothetical protein
VLALLEDDLTSASYDFMVRAGSGFEARDCLLRLAVSAAEIRVDGSRYLTTRMLAPLALHAWADLPCHVRAPDSAAATTIAASDLPHLPTLLELTDEQTQSRLIVLHDDASDCLRIGVVTAQATDVVLAAADSRVVWEVLVETISRAVPTA